MQRWIARLATGLTSSKAKEARETHLQTSCSLESNLFYAAKKQVHGIKFIDTLSAPLNDSNAKRHIYCAKVMPHLILASTRTEDDASKNKQSKTVRPMQSGTLTSFS